MKVKDHDHLSSVFWANFGQPFKFQAKQKNSHFPVYPYLKICYYKRELYELKDMHFPCMTIFKNL